MKKLFLFIFCGILSITTFAQSNLNFENWTGNDPNGWSSSNDLTTQNGGAQTVFKETASPGQGSASIKMVTGSCPKCPTYLSDISWGMIDCTLPNPYGGYIEYGALMDAGIPYTQRPISVDFKYKSKPAGNDAGGFGITLTHYNAGTGETETVGEAFFKADAQITEWTQMNIPVVYYLTATPDTLNIYASSSIGSMMDCSNSLVFPNMPSPYTDWGLPYPVAGSEFYLDAIVINLPSCAGFSLTVTGTNETAVGANDGTAMANPGGGAAPYSYSWSSLQSTQSISGLVPGYYYVTVTDANQCQKVGGYYVAPGGCNLSVSVSGTNSSTNSIYTGNGSAMATASGGNAPYEFQWNNGTAATGTSSALSNLPVGSYAVLVSEQGNPACAVWGYYTVWGPLGPPAGAAPISIKNEIAVFPNPASADIYFNFSESIAGELTLYDAIGKSMGTCKISGARHAVSVASWPESVYFYRVCDKNGKFLIGKFSVVK